MLEEPRQTVYEANMELPRRGLVAYAWENVSGIGRRKEPFVIKPSGVDYDKLRPSQMVVVDLEGNGAGDDMNPSSDTATHMELYKAFKDIDDIVHTRSPRTAVWVQARRALPCYGTTHADYFYGEIPCAKNLTEEEIEEGYEINTGKMIVEAFAGKNPVYVPTVLYRNHGPFTWGKDAAGAVHNTVVLEEMTKTNYVTEMLNPQVEPALQCMLDKHSMRKHGSNAYYG